MYDIAELKTASDGLLALNNAFAYETSYLTPEEWRHMSAQARFALAHGDDGFLIVFDRTADYHSPNFTWFKTRYDRFCYIDRVVIAQAAQGKGLGKALYAHLLNAARDAGYTHIVCEINLEPPNSRSLAFHERLGFEAVGEQVLPSGKPVRYFVKAVPGPDPA